MTHYPVAILCGGLSTRLKEKTKNTPKALLEIAGKTFIDWQIELLVEKDIENVVLCVGHFGRNVEGYVGDGSKYGLEIAYSYDGDELLGTGGAIKKALPKLGDAFFVMYGDSYLDVDFNAVAQHFDALGKDCLLTIFKNEGKFDKSNIVYKNGNIIKYDKTEKDPEMQYIDYGLVLMKKECFEVFKDTSSFDLSEVFKKMISEGKATGYEVTKRFYEIGSFEGLKETEEHLLKKGKSYSGKTPY